MKKEEIQVKIDHLEGRIYATRVIDGQMYGVSKKFELREYFFCPNCKTKDSRQIKEINIDGRPELENVAFGYGVRDNKYGTTDIYHDRNHSKHWVTNRHNVVSFKYLCENCRNEHTKPQLLEALRERDKELDGSMKEIYQELYEKLRTYSPPLEIK